MTINIADNSPRITYTVAQGVTQTSFVVPFEFFDDEDLNVYVDGVLKTLNTHYTTTGGDGSTGSITMSVTGGTGGSSVVITRSITLERVTDFPVSGAFNIVALNTELDRFVAIAADLEDKASRALQLTDYDISTSLILPDLDSRKGRTLAFNSSTGAAEAGPLISDVNSVADASADIALLADIQDGTIATNAITDLAAIKTDVTTVSGIASNVTTVAGIQANVTTVSGISANVTTVAGISSNVTTVATNNANVTTVATGISNVNTVATNIADVNTVATNINSVNNFADTYVVSATEPTSPVEGMLWFDTSTDIMKVYNGSSFQNAGSSVNGTSQRDTYIATGGQTTFAATYDAGYVDVYLNGVKLIDGTDFTATNGSSIVLASGATAGDTVDIVAYGVFELANVYTQTQSDARYVQQTDIGVTVQAYDADTAKLDVAQTFTADQTISAELKATSYNETYSAVTSTSNAVTVDCESGNVFGHTLTENTTFTFSNPPASGTAYGMTINIIQDASASGYTVTWPASVDWAGATAPTLTATASAVDVFGFFTHDGGTTWFGFTAGQAMG